MNVPLLDIKEQNSALRPQIEAALGRVLDTNAFILGDEVAALETEIAEYCDTRSAIGCASGSDALLLALQAFDVGPGDEVITSPYTFFASVSAITRLGATPVLVDIEPDTFNIDANALERAITPRTKAIQPIHLFGQCAGMDKIAAVVESVADRKIAVIEDAAQAIGAEWNGRRAGSMGDVGCFSFYPSKNLGGMGDGGMMTVNDPELSEKLKALRVHGSRERYYHEWVGLNSRLDGFQGAILRVKLPHLEGWTEARRRNAELYREFFADAALDDRVKLPFVCEEARHIYNQFVIRVPEHRDALRSHLTDNGVGTDIYYPVPLHLQECFRFLGYAAGDLPEAELAAKETLALPIYPELTDDQQAYVVERIAEFFTQSK